MPAATPLPWELLVRRIGGQPRRNQKRSVSGSIRTQRGSVSEAPRAGGRPAGRPAGRNRVVWAGTAVLCLALVGVLTLRPWLDSALTAQVTLTTDQSGPVVVLRARKLFSEKAPDLPVYEEEVDLSRWSGQLVRLDVDGTMHRRGVATASTGRIACRAEVVSPRGAEPLEFVSWQFGATTHLHPRRLGPVALQAGQVGKSGAPFAFAGQGTLWHVLKVPEGARLRLQLSPLPDARVKGPPRAYVAQQVTSERHLSPLPRQPERKPDVFIYLIDALRPDHLGCYGYRRATSPEIDAFARDTALYEEAFAAGTWTRSSVATIFTGLYGCVHGAVHETDALAQWPVLLPEMLRGAGYTTRCISGNGNVTGELGFDQGFDEITFLDRAPASWIATAVAKRLAAQHPAKPIFMYLHAVEPHGPLTPGADVMRRFDRGLKGRYGGSSASLDKISVLHPDLTDTDIGHLVDLYDARVFEADQGFGQFIRALKKAGRYDNSLIILLSDHGEAFAEHDTFGHGWSLNRETMRVVLVAKYPESRHAGRQVRQRVSLVDVVPTAIEQVGLRPDLPYPLPGRSLTPERLAESRRIYGETSMWEANNLDLVAVIDEDGYKRVIDASVPPRETATKQSVGLWDTSSDPDEHDDLSAKLPVRAAYDEQLIAAWLLEQRAWRERVAAPPAPKVKLSAELQRKLRDLGYLKGGGASPQQR